MTEPYRPEQFGSPSDSTPFDARLGFDFGAIDAAEAAEFEAVLAELGASTPAEPSAQLKDSILARLDSTAQLDPEPALVAAPALDVSNATPFARSSSTTEESRRFSAGPAERRAASRWFARPVAIVAAAAAAVVFFGGGALVGGLAGSHSSPEASALVRVSAASDSQRSSARVAGGGTATVVSSNALASSVILMRGVHAAPSGKTYQLWYIKGASIRSAGTFDVTGNATTAVALQGRLVDGDVVAVTVEPAGGSKQPTSAPVASMPA